MNKQSIRWIKGDYRVNKWNDKKNKFTKIILNLIVTQIELWTIEILLNIFQSKFPIMVIDLSTICIKDIWKMDQFSTNNNCI